MSHNIAVVGAVIHLGPSHSAQTFAPNLSQQVAIIKGFGIEDEQMALLKAKSHLMYVNTPTRIENILILFQPTSRGRPPGSGLW